jgi:hypothetical protein
MAPDSGEPDAAALRDRVAQLEQTVADQQATIESLSSPPASRRGVLAALTGVAGAGALGAYSQRASAQAAGQVGTQSEPVDVVAWDLTVQNQLAGDLDAGDNSLTNVGAVEAQQLSDGVAGDGNNITRVWGDADEFVTLGVWRYAPGGTLSTSNNSYEELGDAEDRSEFGATGFLSVTDLTNLGSELYVSLSGRVDDISTGETATLRARSSPATESSFNETGGFNTDANQYSGGGIFWIESSVTGGSVTYSYIDVILLRKIV